MTKTKTVYPFENIQKAPFLNGFAKTLQCDTLFAAIKMQMIGQNKQKKKNICNVIATTLTNEMKLLSILLLY